MKITMMSGLSALALALPVAASAQPREGQPFTASGRLEQCQCRLGDHRVRLEAGRRYEISATASAFDSMLRLLRPGSTEPLASDDDSGGGQNPRILYIAPETGEYLVRVVSFAPEGAGDYQLSVRALEALPPPQTRPTTTETMTWEVFEGAIAADDPQDSEGRFDDYEVELQTGQPVFIQTQAESLDTVVKVYAADRRGAEAIVTDDDSGGGQNAFLTFTPERAGAYVVRVSSFSRDAIGSYRLRIGR